MIPTLLAAAALALPLASGHHEQVQCDRYASPSGNDSASGREAAPVRSPQRLASILKPGQTGCFQAGVYDSSSTGIKISRPGITLTAAPGARPTLIGRLWVAEGADGVTISNLRLNGRNPSNGAGPVVNAADTHFTDVDVTNHHTTICFILGSFDYGAARRTVIEGSRIHDCGTLPPQNHDHGIYVENSYGALIRNNWIYDNADRGIQLYPHSVGSRIYGNVIVDNGQGVIFSGAGQSVSSGNLVEGNVIAYSRVRWNIESFWDGAVGSENLARKNCVYPGNPSGYYNQHGGVQPSHGGAAGFQARENVVARPRFQNRARGDFRLVPDTRCASLLGQHD